MCKKRKLLSLKKTSRNKQTVLYGNIDQKLWNSLHRLLNCERGGLDCRVITIEYRTRVQCIHMYLIFCNAFVLVIYSGVSDQCSYTIMITSIIKQTINRKTSLYDIITLYKKTTLNATYACFVSNDELYIYA